MLSLHQVHFDGLCPFNLVYFDNLSLKRTCGNIIGCRPKEAWNGPFKTGTAYLDLVLKSYPQLRCAEYVCNAMDTNVFRGLRYAEESSARSSDLVKVQAELAEADTPSYALGMETATAI